MNPSPLDGYLIMPDKGEIWRPFYAYGIIAGLALSTASIAVLRGSEIALPVAIYIGLACMLCAAARTLVWWLLPGRVIVGYDHAGIHVRRGDKVLRTYRWSDTRRVWLAWGDRWPEWSRWAVFPSLSVEIDEGKGLKLKRSPAFLIVNPDTVRRAEKVLEAVSARYIVD